MFRRDALERELSSCSDEVLSQATDDAWLIERAGGSVGVVQADPGNIKITTELDLRLAQMLVADRGS